LRIKSLLNSSLVDISIFILYAFALLKFATEKSFVPLPKSLLFSSSAKLIEHLFWVGSHGEPTVKYGRCSCQNIS